MTLLLVIDGAVASGADEHLDASEAMVWKERGGCRRVFPVRIGTCGGNSERAFPGCGAGIVRFGCGERHRRFRGQTGGPCRGVLAGDRSGAGPADGPRHEVVAHRSAAG